MSKPRKTSSALALALMVAACTAASSPAEERVVTDEAAPAPAVDAAAPVQASPEPEVAPPQPEPTPPCAAAVADVPTALFDDTVLIRAPVGVELVEVTPTLARTQAPTTSACDRVVTQMLVGRFDDEPSRALIDLRDQTAAATGLPPEAITWTETHEQPNRLESAYTARATDGAPPARGWFVITRMQGVVAWVQLETAVADFDALAPTLKASGERLLMLPGG